MGNINVLSRANLEALLADIQASLASAGTSAAAQQAAITANTEAIAQAQAALALIDVPPWEFHVEKYKSQGLSDYAAINQAFDDAHYYANASGTFYCEVVLAPRTHDITGPYQTKYYGNAQIPLPYQSMVDNKVTMVVRGARDASALPTWRQTTPQRSGAVLKSTGTGGATNATNGDYAVLGGPSPERGFGRSGDQAQAGPDVGQYNTWNNLMLVIDGVSVVVPTPANQMGFQLSGIAEVYIGSVSAFANGATAGATPYLKPTNGRAIGLEMPGDYNNANNTIDNFSVEGFGTGLILGEHTVVQNLRTVYCNVGTLAKNFAHKCIVHYAVVELCNIGIDHQGRADFLMADFEDNSQVATPFATERYVRASPVADGVIRYATLDGLNVPIDPNRLEIAEGSAVRILDTRPKQGYRDSNPAIPNSGDFVLNPYYRDAYVRIAGGTVSKVEVWSPGTAAGYKTVATSTDSTFFVPTGSYVKMTGAPASWTWCLTAATL